MQIKDGELRKRVELGGENEKFKRLRRRLSSLRVFRSAHATSGPHIERQLGRHGAGFFYSGPQTRRCRCQPLASSIPFLSHATLMVTF